MFNLGNDNQKGSFGIIELFKARVGEILVYGGELIRYLVTLEGQQFKDRFEIPQTEKVYNVPATGVFEFGINCVIPQGQPIDQELVLIGYTGLSFAGEFSLSYFNGSLSLVFISPTTGVNGIVFDSFSDYEGQVVRIRAGWYTNNQVCLFINETLVETAIINTRPSLLPTTNVLFINARGDGDGSQTSGGGFNGIKIISWFIDNDKFLLPEGNGFVTTSESGTNATGKTDNPLQLSYWDSVVWGLNQFFYLKFNATNQNYSFIPQTEKVYNVPATGVFEFGIKIRVPDDGSKLMGYQQGTSFEENRYSFIIFSDGVLRFRTGLDFPLVINFPDFIENYKNQIVDLKAGWYGNELRLYINNELVATQSNPSNLRPTVPPNIDFIIGGNNSLEIYSWFIGDDYFNTIQSEGFETVSSLGTIATGSTNTSLEDWNSNVIKEILPPRLLNFNATNEEYSFIPQTEKVYSVPATGDFRFGIKVKIAPTVESRNKGLLGYDPSSGDVTLNSRFAFFINPAGILVFLNSDNSAFGITTLPNFEQDYAGQIVEIIGEYFDEGLRILINGNIEATSSSSIRPLNINSNIPFRIGVRGNADGTGITPNSSFNGEIYSWFIGNDYFNTIQSEGFETISSLGTTSTGSTNTSLEDWDNEVIEII